MDETELRAWIEGARQGDSQAFGEIVLHVSAPLRARLRPMGFGSDELDDVVQDTFVRAWERLDDFDPTRPFEPWIKRIGVNLALDRIRRRKVRHEVDDAVLETVAVDDHGLESMDHRQLLDAIEAAMEELPADWALILRLKAVDEMTTPEIATRLDIPPGTVMSRLSRARNRLRSILAATHGHHEEDPA